MTTITLAYSPDTDDAFMIEPLRLGLVSSLGFKIEFHMDDIQKLNEEAKKATYDITAISMAAYPFVCHNYFMMPVGASIGDGFGPAIVVRESSTISNIESLKGKIIAVPGAMTSAHFAARAVLPEFEARFMLFSDIEDAVLSGEVDAGLLIHELQMDVSGHGLRKLTDLGTLWAGQHHLPLPLGANAIRRSLGQDKIQLLTSVYLKSIEYALRHRTEILYRARDLARPELTNQEADRYIDMYVNHRSLTLDDDVRRGMKILFAAGEKYGFCAAPAIDANIVS
jgi:1,4-dihydroxy-6-naphthoate synthase